MKEFHALFHHCHEALELDGWLMPVRFSQARIGEYLIYRPECPYSRCPAGVTMEFDTDAQVISFECKIRSIVAGAYNTADIFDVYENGTFAGVARSAMLAPSRIFYRLKNKGRTRVCVYLPVGCEVSVRGFELGDYTPVAANPERKKLLVAGDSISQGLFGENPSQAWVPTLARSLNLDYLNLSIGGDVFRPGLIPEDLNFTPSLLVVELGTNDQGFVRDRDKIRQNITDFFAQIAGRFSKIPVIIITPFWMTFLDDGSDRAREHADYTAWLYGIVLEQARPYGFIVCDGRTMIPHDFEYFADHCHPNNLGFAALAESVEKIIREL